MRVCGNREMLGLALRPMSRGGIVVTRPTFYVQDAVPPFSRTATIDLLTEAFNRWSAHCNWIWGHTEANDANLLVMTIDFNDGPHGTLADCQLPFSDGRQQQMRFDKQSRFVASDNPPSGKISFGITACHECGHAGGLGHFPTNPPEDIMEPEYDPRVSKPQEAEGAIMAKWYGEPKPIDIGGGIVPAVIPVSIEVEAHGGKYRATGRAKRV